MIPSLHRIVLSLAALLLLSACARSAHQTGEDVLDRIIPSDIRAQVDESVTFRQLRASPDSYVGRTVMFSGVAMKSRRVKDHTEIEVLQLPTDEGMPSDRRSQSDGRFIAIKSGEFLDPAVIEKGTPLTVIGEVKGATTKAMDEGEYVYPMIEIKHLVDWEDVRSRDRDRPYSGYGYGYYGYPYSPFYYGSPYSYWGPYGLYPYPYGYYGPWFVPTPSPSPSPPPRSSTPPQFQKGR